MIKTDEELIWESYVITEDLNSTMNGVRAMLQRNGVDNFNEVANALEGIYKSVNDMYDANDETLSKSNKRDNTDGNILAMVGLYLGDDDRDLNFIKPLYVDYLRLPKLVAQKEMRKQFDDVVNTIKSKKLFNDNEGKQKLFKEFNIAFSGLVHQHIGVKNSEDAEAYKARQISDNSDVVYSDENITVYVADSRAKTIKYGRLSGNPNLCISTLGVGNYYWKYRLGKFRDDDLGMTTYFVISKDGKQNKNVLVDVLGDKDGDANKLSYNTITPNTDRDVSQEDLVKMYPSLAPVFEQEKFIFIPYTNEEERGFYIEENINSILSPELKSKTDVDMFIELGKKIDSDEWEQIKANDSPLLNFKYILKKYVEGEHAMTIPASIITKYIKSGSTLSKRLDISRTRFLQNWAEMYA